MDRALSSCERDAVLRRWLRRYRDRRRNDAAARQRALEWLHTHHPDETARDVWSRAREPDRTVLAIILTSERLHRGRPPHHLVVVGRDGVAELPAEWSSPYTLRGIK